MIKEVMKRNLYTIVRDINGNFSKVFCVTKSEFDTLKKNPYHEKSSIFDNVYSCLVLTSKGTSLVYYKK